MGHEGRAGVKDGEDRDLRMIRWISEDDQVGVWRVPSKEKHPNTELG